MPFDYNRNVFRAVRGVPGVAPLAAAYCSCILLELSLKQYLGLIGTPQGGGHNLPHLLNRIGARHPQHKPICNVLRTQLENIASGIFCQGNDGNPKRVVASAYPNIRYVRHDSDWTQDCTSDDKIANLKAHLDRIINFLTKSIKCPV